MSAPSILYCTSLLILFYFIPHVHRRPHSFSTAHPRCSPWISWIDNRLSAHWKGRQYLRLPSPSRTLPPRGGMQQLRQPFIPGVRGGGGGGESSQTGTGHFGFPLAAGGTSQVLASPKGNPWLPRLAQCTTRPLVTSTADLKSIASYSALVCKP
ncbi:hypothetical protein BS47DRAFT_1032600 [Hydnum rufescens UP504]|uniref:Uncharacterized protein n=1 Tax=Hydnum rufescens UP504 TaxID=1448309 RepID=A0A9P6AVV1_9AGAM|nr:hypothetical protein BS47DRAFT_1032600 [Hydnum rufescens UP504]